jgi:hypothetical protein
MIESKIILKKMDEEKAKVFRSLAGYKGKSQ